MADVFIENDGSLTQKVDVVLQYQTTTKEVFISYAAKMVDVGLRDQFFDRFLRSYKNRCPSPNFRFGQRRPPSEIFAQSLCFSPFFFF